MIGRSPRVGEAARFVVVSKLANQMCNLQTKCKKGFEGVQIYAEAELEAWHLEYRRKVRYEGYQGLEEGRVAIGARKSWRLKLVLGFGGAFRDSGLLFGLP
ncbi:unnamed protein product [Dovyalis caffra]|uniref:Uncharacterized protein n=1 Tax=Dovyalis caffra TaxID=77055 RepID=A0AAV1RJ25_9ROSI|nr:unnamed protein product [Dovyalis caffra]